MEADRNLSASWLEPRGVRLAPMTVQSSFLIRCWLNAAGDSSSGKAFYIQHVQTGAEFRSATITDAATWITEQNLRFLAETIGNTPAGADSGAQEDLQ